MSAVCGIPMAMIPHPQGAWLEGITPVTNLQWQRGVISLMGPGARYCLLEPDGRGDLTARHLGDLKDVLDTFGRDSVSYWNGFEVLERKISGRGTVALFEWDPKMLRPGFDGDHQPVVDVSWYHAKGWTLAQGGLYLLTDPQWQWSAQGGDRLLEYATQTGELFGPDGRQLVHYSVGTEEQATIDVDDPRYQSGPFGLRHKTGNVWEWVERNPNEKNQYGLRGGSWGYDDPEYLRASSRLIHDPDYRDFNFGFRVGASAP